MKNTSKSAKDATLEILSFTPEKRKKQRFSLLFMPPAERRRNGGLYERSKY